MPWQPQYDPLDQISPDQITPEDVIESAVAYLQSKYDDTRLEFLKAAYEGFQVMQQTGRIRDYFLNRHAEWIEDHYGEILEAARYLIRFEELKQAGRMH